MSGEYLLDTNLVIALLEREAGVLARFEKEGAVSISVVTCGELGYGARKSSRVEKNLARIEAFADDCTVLACDRSVARRYGVVKLALQRRGRPIPENDLWIAATALEHDLVLVTRDAHFDAVEGLRTETW